MRQVTLVNIPIYRWQQWSNYITILTLVFTLYSPTALFKTVWEAEKD